VDEAEKQSRLALALQSWRRMAGDVPVYIAAGQRERRGLLCVSGRDGAAEAGGISEGRHRPREPRSAGLRANHLYVSEPPVCRDYCWHCLCAAV
jgi:hypothetical protein